jgi:CubicO group peptidase (beta-lactamase class C family)
MRTLVLAWLLACSAGCAARAQVAYPFQPGVAQPADKAKLVAIAPQFDALLLDQFNASKATAMVAGIVLDGELVYARAFGERDPQRQQPVDLDSLFRMASLTKSFTAMAIMKLRDEGKLSLDAPLVSYLPEFTALGATTRDAAPVTARALLTHSAGLPWDDLWGAVSFGFEEEDWRALLQSGLSPAHVPGTDYEYSNLGYALLGKLIERISGMPYRDYVTSNILRPLGMHGAVWASGAAATPPANLAVGYWGDKQPQSPAPRVSDGVFEPAGGLYLSLRDYARYVAYQLAAYPPRDAPEAGPIRRSALREMHQGQRAERRAGANEPIAKRMLDGIELRASNYGFGWSNIITCTESPRIEHGGWEPGYFSAVTLLPQHRLGIMTFSASRFVPTFTPMLELIRNAGALPAEIEPPADPALVEAQRGIISLLAAWDPALASRLIDPRSHHYPWSQRLPETFAKAAREHGHCQPEGALHRFSRLYGKFRLQCERGALEVDVTLSPARPPRVLLVKLDRELPPDERLGEAATRITAAIGATVAPDPSWFAPEVDPRRAQKLLAHAAISHGTCAIERATAGDGHNTAVFLLRCTEGKLELAITADPSGQVTSLDLRQPRAFDAPCWQ